MENEKNTIDVNKKYQAYVGVKFENSLRSYFFGVFDKSLQLEDKVIVETAKGIELGFVKYPPVDITCYKSNLGLKPVLRKATESDIKIYESNKKDAALAMKICQNEVNNLKLDMNLLSCEYTLDKSKVTFTYLADERVDFRELVKILAFKLHTRIDLRQIGPRDKAKNVGGLGACGRPLCCSCFLSEFDGISINTAKNQLLAINIPKLSGQCGKLMCCLKFEDDAYNQLKKEFPDIGYQVTIDKVNYNVTGLNVLSGTVKLEGGENVLFLDLDEFKKKTNFRPKRDFKNFKNDKK